MNVLAIDTSNTTLGIAIINEDQVIGEYITNMKKNHSIRVMPAMERLLSDCDLKPADLDKIVVAKGPGSYTGVRIGVTIAKTLAWTLNVPLVGISSLEALAAGVARHFDGFVSPLFDARRGQIYTGLYQFKDGQLQTVIKDQILLSVDWAEQLQTYNEKILFVGGDLPIHIEGIRQVLGDRAVFAEVTEHNPPPSELSLIWRNMPAEDIHTILPKYIRLSEAEATWIKKQKGLKQL